MYEGVFAKAAAVLERIARNHPFVDANKRTAFMTALAVIENNDYKTFFDQKNTEESMVQFVVEKPPLSEIAAWLEKNAKKV